MMNKTLAALAAVLFTACLDQPDQTVEHSGDDLEPATRVQTDNSVPREHGDQKEERPLCERVVATEGVCAVACDPDAVFEFITEGACELFVCVIDDGTHINIGGCKWD